MFNNILINRTFKSLFSKFILIFLVANFLFSGSAYTKETIRVLTWNGYAPSKLIKAFEAKYNINVKLTYSNNEEMIAKLLATRGAGFDLAQPSQDRIFFAQKKYPIYQPIDYSKINTSQLIDSMVTAVKRNTTVDGKIYGVPHVYGTTGLIINKKLAPNANDWSDLWNPKYKGKISYRLKRPLLIAAAFGMGEDPFALYSDIKAYEKLMKKVEALLIKTKPLVKNYWTSGDTQVEVIKSGDANVISGWDGKGWVLHKSNPDIDFVAPKSGALGWVDTFAIPSKAKNLDAVYKYINFMLEAKNAAFFTNTEGYGTASKDAAKHYNSEVKDNFSRTFSKADINNIKWHPSVPKGFEEIESRILDRIKAAN